MVLRPGDSEVIFSVVESSYHLLLLKPETFKTLSPISLNHLHTTS